jgi:hypothetical protein
MMTRQANDIRAKSKVYKDNDMVDVSVGCDERDANEINTSKLCRRGMFVQNK